MTSSHAPRSGSSRSRRFHVGKVLLRPLHLAVLLAFGLGLAVMYLQVQRTPAPMPEAASIAVLAPALPELAIPELDLTARGVSAAPTILAAPKVLQLLNYEEPAALAQTVASLLPVPVTPPPTHKPRIAIVIDDIGPDWTGSKAAIALPAPLTLALLPYAERVGELATRAQRQGHELIIHMPMEPMDLAHNNPGPIALLTAQKAAVQQEMLTKALRSFTGYVGLNNHMGSRFTADSAGMQRVFAELAQRRLYFLDSRTTPNSVGAPLAAQFGVRYAGRDVFLDNQADVGKILQQLQLTEKIARQKGYAIAIGHPHLETVAALKQWLPRAQAAGFELVPVSALVAPASRAQLASQTR
jgi:polysaccharide deacetylase 2 family uncharacterized protein YibQ